MIARFSGAALIAAAVVASGARAEAPPQSVISGVSPAADGRLAVDVLLTNPGATDVAAPGSIAATIRVVGRDVETTLLRAVAPVTIRPGGFALVGYRSARPVDGTGDAVLLLGGASGGYAFAMTGSQAEVAASAPAPAAPSAAPGPAPAGTIAARDNAPMPGNGFLGNLSSYGPIYAAFGHGTDSDGKLELGFKISALRSRGRSDVALVRRHPLRLHAIYVLGCRP